MCVFLGLSMRCDALSIPGAYLQLQGGIGGMDTQHYQNNSDPYNQVSIKDGFASRVSVGYLTARDELSTGLELGYAGYPNNNYSFPSLPARGSQCYKGNTLDLLGVLRLNLHKIVHHDVYLLGKAGIAHVNQTFNGKSMAFGTVFAFNKTVRQFEPEVAGEIGYLIGKNADINLSYHHVFSGGSANPFADSVANRSSLTQLSAVDLLMAGIAYHFA